MMTNTISATMASVLESPSPASPAPATAASIRFFGFTPARGGGGTGMGGIGASILTLNLSQVDGNTSDGGPNAGAGGVANGGTATINARLVNGNTTPGAAGGGILNHGTMTISGGQVNGNMVPADGSGDHAGGGGIANLNFGLITGATGERAAERPGSCPPGVAGAAAGLFARRDVEGVSLRDIAAAADVQLALIALPPDRWELIRAVFDDLGLDISWLESLALEGRASYYDTAGAMKDMVQNHLMEAMALVLMEQPARIDAGSFRGVRVEALRAVATPAAQTMRRHTIRARRTAGTIGTRQVPSYVDEPGVDPSRNTETYASLTVEMDSPRWAGVPFTLRSGKTLAADSAEIAVHFRPLPRYLLGQWPGVEPNVLTVGLTEPCVRLSTTLNGPERTAGTRQLEARSAPPRFTAYAHLILEMLNSDPMLFIRGDEAEEAAHHRPRDESLVGRRRPHAGIPSRPGTARPPVVTRTATCRRPGDPAQRPSRVRSPARTGPGTGIAPSSGHLRRDPPRRQGHRPAPRRAPLPVPGLGRPGPRLGGPGGFTRPPPGCASCGISGGPGTSHPASCAATPSRATARRCPGSQYCRLASATAPGVLRPVICTEDGTPPQLVVTAWGFQG